MEFDDDAPLAKSFKRKRKVNKDPPAVLEGPPKLPAAGEEFTANAQQGILVSEFDYSVDNHFKFVDTMTTLCGCPQALEADHAEVKQFSNSVTFLREWRDFNYKPRAVKFACLISSEEKDVIGGVTLSQFSSACVPKKETLNGSGIDVKYSKDFVMNVGGAVWALDWCPRVGSDSQKCINCEKLQTPTFDASELARSLFLSFVSVAGHPPDSSYHKIGVPLTGRGAIQIWCLLTVNATDGPSQENKKSRLKIQKKPIVTSGELTKVPRPRGRPRKMSLPESLEKIDADNEHAQPLAIEYPMGSSEFNSSDCTSRNACKHVNDEDCVRVNDGSNLRQANTLLLTAPRGRVNKRKAGKDAQIHKNSLHFLRQCEHGEPALGPLKSAGSGLDLGSPDKNITCISSSDANTTKNFIPVDAALPRMIMCLAHNGKVAWDVKWRPVDAYHPESIYIMGYLAVLLGNGALEVWKVPLPHTVKLVFPVSQEHIDPRFIKLQPVFRCSMLKCGDKRSIPLTVEWSVSSPYDMILAGCHDGVVALWKFFVGDSLTETKPLLSFSADTGPIRTLAWAPNSSDLESPNIIVTGGQKGPKFWDIRDPFRPLWEHPIPVTLTTYGLDWLSDPRCVFGSTDDGTMWLLSLEMAAHDLPVSKKFQYVASKYGFHSFGCSEFSLWSLQASRLTGMAAYCGEEGSTFCFQPTARLLKDPSRNRVHHFLCGSLSEEEDAIIVATPYPNSSLQMRFPYMKRSGGIKEQERRAKQRINNDRALGEGDNMDKLNEGIGREEKEEFEVFPSKNVAIHRVRWNVNKGSEKWLSYGGAAGLVRCQEVDFFSQH